MILLEDKGNIIEYNTKIIIYLICSLLSIISICGLIILFIKTKKENRKLSFKLIILMNIGDLLLILPNIPLFIAYLIDENITVYN